jgi:hypothetical protein
MSQLPLKQSCRPEPDEVLVQRSDQAVARSRDLLDGSAHLLKPPYCKLSETDARDRSERDGEAKPMMLRASTPDVIAGRLARTTKV